MELTDSEVAFLIASMRSSLSIELGYEKCPCVFLFPCRGSKKVSHNSQDERQLVSQRRNYDVGVCSVPPAEHVLVDASGSTILGSVASNAGRFSTKTSPSEARVVQIPTSTSRGWRHVGAGNVEANTWELMVNK